MSEMVTREKNGVLIIYFTTDDVRSEGAVTRIGEQLANLAHSAGGKVLVDFSGVQQVSSGQLDWRPSFPHLRPIVSTGNGRSSGSCANRRLIPAVS